MKDLSTYIVEAKRLSDLKGRTTPVKSIKTSNGDNLIWSKPAGDWASINDIKVLQEKDIDDIYKVYESKGSVYVGFEYDGHRWYMEIRNAPGHRIAVFIYKDDVYINTVAFFTGLLNFREFWYQTIPKILEAY